MKNGQSELNNQESSDKKVSKDHKHNSKTPSLNNNGFIDAKPADKVTQVMPSNLNKSLVQSHEFTNGSIVSSKKVTDTMTQEKECNDSTTVKEMQMLKPEGKRELPTKIIEVHRQKLRLIKMMSRQPEMK